MKIKKMLSIFALCMCLVGGSFAATTSFLKATDPPCVKDCPAKSGKGCALWGCSYKNDGSVDCLYPTSCDGPGIEVPGEF
jgi:hypothetical protein